jgi:hypothetical protein
VLNKVFCHKGAQNDGGEAPLTLNHSTTWRKVNGDMLRVSTGGSHSRCGCRTIETTLHHPPVRVIATLTVLSRIVLLRYALDISYILHHFTRTSHSFHPSLYIYIYMPPFVIQSVHYKAIITLMYVNIMKPT